MVQAEQGPLRHHVERVEDLLHTASGSSVVLGQIQSVHHGPDAAGRSDRTGHARLPQRAQAAAGIADRRRESAAAEHAGGRPPRTAPLRRASPARRRPPGAAGSRGGTRLRAAPAGRSFLPGRRLGAQLEHHRPARRTGGPTLYSTGYGMSPWNSTASALPIEAQPVGPERQGILDAHPFALLHGLRWSTLRCKRRPRSV